MLHVYSDELNEAEDHLHEEIRNAKDIKEIEEEYERMKKIYQNLIDLKESIKEKE